MGESPPGPLPLSDYLAPSGEPLVIILLRRVSSLLRRRLQTGKNRLDKNIVKNSLTFTIKWA